jgi:serine/threonine protein kinase
VFDEGTQFAAKEIFNTLLNTASVLEQLHSKGIMHGDFYAHNLMIDADANVLLGDFGAATLYDLNSIDAIFHEQIDVRAFGCLIDDLLMHSNEIEEKAIKHFSSLKELCFNEIVSERPTFKEIYQKILSVN